MTRDRWMEDPEALEEAERLYAFIGRYVISIQWFEGKIDELFLLARGHENWSETQAWLGDKYFADKLRRFYNLAITDGRPSSISVSEWTQQMDRLKKRLDDEKERRNGLLHAQYLFDFLAVGGWRSCHEVTHQR